MLQEILRFTKADSAFLNPRPFRFCALYDSFPSSLPYVARFHAKKVLKFRDALLTSYHKNEVISSLSARFHWNLLGMNINCSELSFHIVIIGQICRTNFGHF